MMKTKKNYQLNVFILWTWVAILRIIFSEELRYVLVSDWELLTHKKSLFTLPAKITVNMILSDFRKHVDKPGMVST